MFSTLHAAAAQLRAGTTTPLDLLDGCLERIDRMEERVRAWVFVDHEGARALAKRKGEEIRKGGPRGPLHGVPLGIKDIYDVFDWPTAAGSRLWKNSIARKDATAVRRLREAGAVFIGKTVTTQYASFDPPPTRNPWDPRRTPGGSSSGSAAALACGMCLAALGSQTGGSITRPAAFCGVAGLKPTYGRVGLAGVVPLAASMDHAGPMARCVRDLAVLLQVMAGPDPRDLSAAGVGVPDYTEHVRSYHGKPRLGRLRGLFEVQAESATRERFDEACARLRAAGAVVSDVALPAAFTDVIARHRVVMGVESAMFHEPRLRRHPEDYDPNIRSLLEEGLQRSATEYAETKKHQRRLKAEMEACFHGLDVLATPAAPGPAPDATTTGDPVFNSPWSYTGLPTVCFPHARSAEGMPLGLQLIGRAWGEADLLAAAAWCEDALGFEVGEPAP
jgi:aspartyl-tRNA(Asn)/glutamyl-tRNA(Gln) amidotransferase subunit A